MITKMALKSRIILFLLFLSPGLLSNSQDVSGYLMSAVSLNNGGRYNDAVNVLTEAMKVEGNSKLLIMRAQSYAGLRIYNKAIADLNSANLLTEGSATYDLARVYAMQGDISRSLSYLESHFSTPYRRSEKEIMLDAAFLPLSNTVGWRSFWKTERYNRLEQGVSEIEFYLASGKMEQAIEIQKEISGLYPGTDGALYATALVRNREGNYQEAQKLMTSLVSDEPGNIKYLSLLAGIQKRAGNFAGASTTYSSIIESGVSDASLLLERATCYKETGEFNKALKDTEQFMVYYPGNGDAIRLAGRITAQSGDNLGAIELYSKNIRLNPGDPVCYSDRANSYFVARSWDLAIKDYSMSLDLNPRNAEAWLNKGISMVNSGKPEDACYDLKQALSMGNKKATAYISRYCIK